MKKVYLIIALLCAAFVSKAQFSLTGEITPRAEYRNGFKKPLVSGTEAAFFIEQRSRLYAEFKAEKYEVKLTLQDVRMWGADGQVYKTDNSMFSAVDAWGKYNVSESFAVKVGRQIISYDNQRFFGGLEWAMQGRRHDALLFMYEKSGLKLHVGGAYNQNPMDASEPVRIASTNYSMTGITGHPAGAYHATGNYKHMQFLYLNKKLESGSSFSAYLVNDARQDVGTDATTGALVYGETNARQTLGLMGKIKASDALSFNAELFYQGGKVALDTDVSALMFSASTTIKTDATPIIVGYDYLSGDDETTADKSESFAPSFGTNHAFYGFMDYFYVGNPHKGGLQDIFLKTKFKVAKGALLAHVHYFMSASDVTNQEGTKASAGLGTEIDLVYVRKLTKGVTWKVGYSQMFATDGMKAVKSMASNADIGSNNWAWTQIIFKPKFL